jgi:predicted flap endonuclease-1-like 5' DNA nuclease
MALVLANVLLLALAAAGGGACTYFWLRHRHQDTVLTAASLAQERAALGHGLAERMAALEAAVNALLIPQPQPTDLSPLLEAVAPLQKRLTAIEHALFPVQTRLDELESAVRALRSPPPQLDPLLHRLDAIDERLQHPRRRQVAVRAGSRNLLSHAGHGKPDDLTRIEGVPKTLQKALHKVGVFYFWQIAEWSPEDARYVDGQLAAQAESLAGHIDREAWVAQARSLAAAPSAAHAPVRH